MSSVRLSNRARFLAGAVAAILVVVVIIGFTAGNGSGNGSHRATAHRPLRIVVATLAKSFSSPALGVRGQAPQDWTAIRGQGFVLLRNRDGTATISIQSPGKSTSASNLVASTLASIHTTYAKVTVEHGLRDATLGGLPAKSRTVYATNTHKVRIRILVAGARGKRFNYLMEVFTALRAPVRDVVATQQIVLALHLGV